MVEERILLVTDQEMWAIHHARLAVKGPVLDIVEKWLTRNGWFFEKLRPLTPEKLDLRELEKLANMKLEGNFWRERYSDEDLCNIARKALGMEPNHPLRDASLNHGIFKRKELI